MMSHPMKTNTFALAVICALGALLPTESLADLNNIACRGIWRSCIAKCGASGGAQSCYDTCDDNRFLCERAPTQGKQQTPPPPCTGVRCSLPDPHPPTPVGQPAPQPHPGKPVNQVNPVSVSNPNKTNTGNSGPVLLDRQNGSGGGNVKTH
jgi:hypothetical protein